MCENDYSFLRTKVIFRRGVAFIYLAWGKDENGIHRYKTLG